MENYESKQRLTSYISFVRDCELEKPINEINEEIVGACVKLLLKLQGKEVAFTTEQIKEKVRKIPVVLSADFTGETTKKVKKYTTKKKILLVAAIVTLLAMLLSIIPVADEWNIFDYICEYIGYENVVSDKEYKHNGMSFTSNGIIESFKDINDYPEDNPYDILLPTYLPETISLTELIVADIGDGYQLSVICSNPTMSYKIYLERKIPQTTLVCCTETITVNNKEIHIISLTDIGTYQMYFEYNGDYYDLSFTDKQELLKVIENLEE